MYYSKKLSLLFIASPKSGSTSVEKYLMEVDSSGENHSVTLDLKKITAKDVYYGIGGHARAWELKEAMGEDIYNQLQIFGFVRHPFDKLVSSYFFNKKLKLLSTFN
jgi:hypothetical protein